MQFSLDEAFTNEDEIVPRTREDLSYRREGLAAGTSAYLRVRSVTGTGVDRVTSIWSAPVTGSAVAPESPHREHHAALTAGLPERPFVNVSLGDDNSTVGTLRLGLNPNVFPVIVGQGDAGLSVLVAASRLGEGRMVAFSGTDFLSLEEPGLLGTASVDRLLANAVRWTGSDSTALLRVVADDQGIADALAAEGLGGVEVVGRGPDGFVRDWSASALRDADVAVVVINHRWGARLVEESIAPMRAFVDRGGGLVVAASALHWKRYIERELGPFTGNLLLNGAGIAWNEDRIADITAATTDVDPAQAPAALWGAYLGGGSPDPGVLPGLFESALDLGRHGELDAALVLLVSETPDLPVSADDPQAQLADAVARTLGPHEWPETHPWAADFPGLPDPGAHRVSGSVVVDATWGEFPADARRDERRLPLGFYAPPGGLVRISVPPSHATGELAIEVGQDHDDLRFYPDNKVWRRGPALRRVFEVTVTEIGVTNAYGGSLSVVVPESYSGTIPVTVREAIPMAVYTAGRSSQARWRADLNAGAPQAIIQGRGGIRLVISADAARGISDPGEVAAFWGRVPATPRRTRRRAGAARVREHLDL